jgi:hypothetical protein
MTDTPPTIPARQLAGTASQYKRHEVERPKGDPLGLGGLPEVRDGLDYLVDDLCRRLASFGRDGIGGRWLANTLHLRNTRSLRLLVAYARVHLHRHEIVGLPGQGYVWGECDRAVYKKSILDNMKRGRCHFFIASLLKREGSAMAAVQMVFDWMEHEVPTSDRHNDELAALVASEGVNVATFLDTMVRRLAETERGREVLAQVGQNHAAVLIPKEILTATIKKLDEVRDELLTAGATARTA